MITRKSQKTDSEDNKKDAKKGIWSPIRAVIISWDLWVAIGITITLIAIVAQSIVDITEILEIVLNTSLVIFIGIASITIIGYTLFFAIPKDDKYMKVIVSEEVYDFFLFVPSWIIACCGVGLASSIICQILIKSDWLIGYVSQIIAFDVHYLGLVPLSILLFLMLYAIFAFVMFCRTLTNQRIIQIEEEMLDKEEDDVLSEIEQ